MRSKRFLPLLACFLITAAQARTWIDNQGRTLVADYVSNTSDEVLVLRESDKQKVTLKLSQLSASDKAFVSNKKAAMLDEAKFAWFKPRLQRFIFGTQSCPSKYLGVASIIDRPLGKLPFLCDGISLGKDGAVIVSSGRGTTPHMKLLRWSPDGSVVDIVPLTYKKYDRNESLSERADEERQGRFWFFGGQIAHDSNNQVLFTLGACGGNGGNGIFRVESDAPVQLRRLNECIPSSSLQVPPWDSLHAYIACCNKITRFKLSPNSAELKDVVFSIEGKEVYLGDTLMLSKNKLIAEISLPTTQGISGSGNFGIYIDLEANGYYLLAGDGYLGAMALAPDSSRMIRLINSPDNRSSSISEFELKF
jgi:hypothetical protein